MSEPTKSERPLRIAFIHPHLGIGGAERLVVDAAMCLQAAGHRVTIFTSHHDITHCFEETRDGRLDVRVYGDFLPFHLAHHLRAPCAIARMCYVACRLAMASGGFDLIFCDVISHTIPLLRLFTRAKILFYCHFPDQLLAPRWRGLYRWYRAPIDLAEEITIAMADRVLVNSRFTASKFCVTFQHFTPPAPLVLYPGVDVTCPDEHAERSHEESDAVTILSVNRYERKKNVALAIEALALLRAQLSSAAFVRIRLIVAGGFDSRLKECRETLRNLEALAHNLGLDSQVVFLKSPPDAERVLLLSTCRCVVYTPEEEHFGYVPIEAMAAGRPVVAVNSGGAAETIKDGVTGFLCPPTAQAFSSALASLILEPLTAQSMGRAGRKHVTEHFSRDAFGRQLSQLLKETVAKTPG